MAKEKQLKPQQELFCQYYTSNDELFGNATRSYAEAFHYNLDALSREVPPCEPGEKPQRSEYDLAANVCAVEASRLLRNPKIQARITVLLNKLLRDEVVDSQLARLIIQDVEPATKIAAIREYNKLRGRTVDRTDITTGGKPLIISFDNSFAVTPQTTGGRKK